MGGTNNSPNTQGNNGLGVLTNRSVRPTQKGLDIVKQHLSNPLFTDDGRNALMINRIQNAIDTGTLLTNADASFYMHEISESTIMRGIYTDASYKIAHQAALNKYGVSPFSVYAPEVIQQLRESFHPSWFKFWGIE
jgi:hypothetical protein